MSTFSPNIQFEEVARNADVGTWDTPTNSNWSLVDSVCGAIATIGLNNSNIVLSAAQFQSKQITFNSTLTGSVTITFPTSFTKTYEIQHLCTGSSAFTITLQTTAAGGQVICAAPGETIDCFNDGTNLKYKNLGRVGEYWDYAGTSLPNWVQGCSVPPYLNCAGGTFSAGTYPVLAVVLGGTTLPDSRGRTRYAADAGTGRITGVIGSPNTVGGAGGDQNMQAHTHGNTLSDPGHVHSFTPGNQFPLGGAGSGSANPILGGSANAFTNISIVSAVTGITINNVSAGSGGAQNMPPMFIGGLMLIRAG